VTKNRIVILMKRQRDLKAGIAFKPPPRAGLDRPLQRLTQESQDDDLDEKSEKELSFLHDGSS
jgi:hypothetical protein